MKDMQLLNHDWTLLKSEDAKLRIDAQKNVGKREEEREKERKREKMKVNPE